MIAYLRLLVLILVFIRPGSLRAITPGAPPEQRVLVLVSLDGFRWDYLDKYHPPRLTQLAREGVRAERMIPSFPSLTFPNHYTLVTGLRPGNHGIIANGFRDPAFPANFTMRTGATNGAWWGGEPVWATAIKQGRTADCMFWPGSEAEIGGIRPTKWKPYTSQTTPETNVATVLGWITQPAATRPGIVTLYFPQTDEASHHSGLDSPELAEAVKEVDAAVGRLVDGVHASGLDALVNIIVVSDHGMTELSTNRLITIDDYVDLAAVQLEFSGAVAGLRPRQGTDEELYARFAGHEKNFHVYRREETPERFHFRKGPRIPPVILVADEGWYINSRSTLARMQERRFEPATHGFDPALPSMGATFIAWGPAFRHGVTLKPFENIHVYNLLCATLGLKPAPNDGDNRLVGQVLADDGNVEKAGK